MADKIPKGWKKVKLKDVVKINPHEYLKKGSFAKKVPMESLQPFSKKIRFFILQQYNGGVKFRNGDTIMARITPSLENGKTAFVDLLSNNEIGFGSTEFIVLRSIDEITDSQFLYYFVISANFRDIAIKSMSGSSGRQRVQTAVIKEFEFFLPSLMEQRAIASILSSLDDKIDLLYRENKTLEQMAQTLFRKWFIEDAKEDWKEVPLDDFLKINYGSGKFENREQGKYNVYGAGGIIGKSSNFEYKEEKLIVGCRGTCGNLTITEPFSTVTHNSLVLEPLEFSIYFWYFRLKFANLNSIITGSTQPQITIKDLKNLYVRIPENKNLIKLFESITSVIFAKIQSNKIQIRTLEQLRDTLLPKLMSGEVRVRI